MPLLREILKDKLDPRSFVKDLLLGTVGAASVAITYQLFEVLRQQPDLLIKWGPDFVPWILGITVIGIVLNQLVDALRAGSENLVRSNEITSDAMRVSAEASARNADGMKEMAVAMRQIADQGDGQMREIQAQVAYAAIELRRVHERLTEMGESVRGVAEYVKRKEEERRT